MSYDAKLLAAKEVVGEFHKAKGLEGEDLSTAVDHFETVVRENLGAVTEVLLEHVTCKDLAEAVPLPPPVARAAGQALGGSCCRQHGSKDVEVSAPLRVSAPPKVIVEHVIRFVR
jgi:hypothetical protein